MKRAALAADARGCQCKVAGQQPIVIYDHVRARAPAPVGAQRAVGEPLVEILNAAVEGRENVAFVDRARLGERQPKSRS